MTNKSLGSIILSEKHFFYIILSYIVNMHEKKLRFGENVAFEEKNPESHDFFDKMYMYNAPLFGKVL